jgi:LysR family nitrogen assimilation transcriptional regulator
MRIEENCRRAQVALTLELEVDALHSMLESARDGLGYTIIQPSAVQDELGRGILKGWPIVDPPITMTLSLATGAQRSTSFSVRRLAAIIRQQVLALQKKSEWRRPV